MLPLPAERTGTFAKLRLGHLLRVLPRSGLVIALFFLALFASGTPNPTAARPWQGMNVVLRPGRTYLPLFMHLRSLGANRVALVVTCHQQGTDLDCRDIPPDSEMRTALRDARTAGLAVLLKPHIETTEFSWRGEIEFQSPEEVRKWFANYRPMLTRLAALEPDDLIIGTELSKLSYHEAEWRALVAHVRAQYDGGVYYAANSGEAEHVNWWDAVDAIGIDAYFPLEAASYLTRDIERAWAPHRERMAALAARFNKKIVFLEIGYQSRVNAYLTPWQRDPAIPSLVTQANAYAAVFRAFADADWWGGAVWWDAGKVWYGGIPYPDWESGRYNSWDVGFTPIGKPAEHILRHYWADAFPAP